MKHFNFKYQNSSFLVKDLISSKQNKNEKLVNNINNWMIDLGKKKFLKIKILKK